MTADRAADLAQRITAYLSAGGLFNPEAMEHNKVRDLLIDCRDELARLGLDAPPRDDAVICPQCGTKFPCHT